jgi:hypothetical protein
VLRDFAGAALDRINAFCGGTNNKAAEIVTVSGNHRFQPLTFGFAFNASERKKRNQTRCLLYGELALAQRVLRDFAGAALDAAVRIIKPPRSSQ